MSNPDDGLTPHQHVYSDGGWVMTYRTDDGLLVDGDGERVIPTPVEASQYVGTVLVDGERYRQYESSAGVIEYYDANGDLAEGLHEPFDLLDAAPRFGVHEGQLHRIFDDAETGRELVLDAQGNEVVIDTAELSDMPTFVSFGEYSGRRCVIGVDADGNNQLYTPKGQLIDTPIDPNRLVELDVDGMSGTPMAIGDYTFDHGVSRVYVFPSGAQAIRDEFGEFEPVIVPTDAEYPDGRAFFEGTFETGFDGQSNGTVDMFSYADGQTAYLVDGELVIVDSGLDSTFPDGPPVSLGAFPDGDLYVVPDGRQLLRTEDGSWEIANYPDLAPYDELVDAYAPLDDETPFPDLPSGPLGGRDLLLDHGFDDITQLATPLVGGRGGGEPPDIESTVATEDGASAGGVPQTEPVLDAPSPGIPGLPDPSVPGSGLDVDFGVPDLEFAETSLHDPLDDALAEVVADDLDPLADGTTEAG